VKIVLPGEPCKFLPLQHPVEELFNFLLKKEGLFKVNAVYYY